MAEQQGEIRFLTPPTVEVKQKKYCRFKKNGIKYIDYKDPEFLKKFLNEQGKILSGNQACSPPRIAALRNRFVEIIKASESNGNHIETRYCQPRIQG